MFAALKVATAPEKLRPAKAAIAIGTTWSGMGGGTAPAWFSPRHADGEALHLKDDVVPSRHCPGGSMRPPWSCPPVASGPRPVRMIHRQAFLAIHPRAPGLVQPSWRRRLGTAPCPERTRRWHRASWPRLPWSPWRLPALVVANWRRGNWPASRPGPAHGWDLR